MKWPTMVIVIVAMILCCWATGRAQCVGGRCSVPSGFYAPAPAAFRGRPAARVKQTPRLTRFVFSGRFRR